jgi:hypothetical protein
MNCAKRLRTHCYSLYPIIITMTALASFKENVFKVLEGYMPLDEFEKWLYKSEELLHLMSNDMVLDGFTFNYKQQDGKYQFKKVIFPYFDEDEFLLWKVKSNLRDLTENRSNRDRILYDFYYLGYDGYYFLQPIGYYMYQIADIEYYGNDLESVLTELRQDSENLLLEIEKQQLGKPRFRLADYQSVHEIGNATTVITKKWWNFWK